MGEIFILFQMKHISTHQYKLQIKCVKLLILLSLILSTGGSQPKKLNEVTVSTMSNAACKATGYKKRQITANMICAGVPEGGKDSCQVRRKSIEKKSTWPLNQAK